MGLPEIPEPHTNNSNVGPPKYLFGPQYAIYVLGLPGENVFCNRRIIIDRFRLLANRFWGHWTSRFLGRLEHRFWGRWASSSLLGLRRNTTSGVAERHRRLRLGELYFWRRCTIIIWIAWKEDICVVWGRTSFSATFFL